MLPADKARHVQELKTEGKRVAIYNILAIPIAAGVLYVSLGIVLRREWSALLMSLSSIIVAMNAVLLKRVERDLGESGARRPATPLASATTSR
jgi:cation transport ATPase